MWKEQAAVFCCNKVFSCYLLFSEQKGETETLYFVRLHLRTICTVWRLVRTLCYWNDCEGRHGKMYSSTIRCCCRSLSMEIMPCGTAHLLHAILRVYTYHCETAGIFVCEEYCMWRLVIKYRLWPRKYNYSISGTDNCQGSSCAALSFWTWLHVRRPSCF